MPNPAGLVVKNGRKMRARSGWGGNAGAGVGHANRQLAGAGQDRERDAGGGGGGKRGLRTVLEQRPQRLDQLVLFQFGLAIAFTIGTGVLIAQTRQARAADLRFRRDGLLVVRSVADSLVAPAQRQALANGLAALPQITSVTFANGAIGGSGEENSDSVSLPGVPGEGPSLKRVTVGPRFSKHMVRGWSRAGCSTTPMAQTMRRISRKASPWWSTGARCPRCGCGRHRKRSAGRGGNRPRTIIGVVDDLRFASPRDPMAPTYYMYYRDPARLGTAVATLRFTGDPQPVVAAARALWLRMAPQVPFYGQTGDHALARFYEADDRATRLFGIGAGLAVLIGCVGLWGLASFNTQRRVKEIGIRKTLGASSADIVRLLVGQFLRPVLLANLVAWPIVWAAMRSWLAGFDDRIALSPVYFLAASLLATTIAVLTVLGQSLRASRAAPAWALRHD